jgi:hypothetical protein
MVIEGVTRSTGVCPRRQAAPAVARVLRLMLAKRPAADTPLGARERACCWLSLARRELVALTLGDVEAVPERGLRLLVRRSKTDQQGQGHDIAVWANPDQPDICPAAALARWMAHRAGCDAGLDRNATPGTRCAPAPPPPAGYADARLAELMRQTRHRSTEVALGYLRPTDLWRNNVTEKAFREGGGKKCPGKRVRQTVSPSGTSPCAISPSQFGATGAVPVSEDLRRPRPSQSCGM